MKSFKTISVSAMVAFALLVSVHLVHASWTTPTGVPPTGNVTAPVNTGATGQTKTGPLVVLNLFMAKQGAFGPNIASMSGTSNIFSALTNPIFGKGLIVGSDGAVNVNGKGLTINLQSPGNSGAVGRNGLDIEATTDNDHAAITTNMPGFHLWSNAVSGGSDAGILAGYGFFKGQVTIQDGTQGAGKVLTSDANGNASWQPGMQTLPSITTGGTTGALIEYVHNDGTMPMTGGGSITATCPSDSFAIGGGADCNGNPIVISNITGSTGGQPSNGNGYTVVCGSSNVNNRAIHSTAVCMKAVALVMQAPTQTTNTTTTTTTTTSSASWHNSTYPSGTTGQSCTAWLAQNGFTTSSTSGPGGTPNVRVYTGGSGSSGPGTGQCGYTTSLGGIQGPMGSAVAGATPSSPTGSGNGGAVLVTQLYY